MFLSFKASSVCNIVIKYASLPGNFSLYCLGMDLSITLHFANDCLPKHLYHLNATQCMEYLYSSAVLLMKFRILNCMQHGANNFFALSYACCQLLSLHFFVPYWFSFLCYALHFVSTLRVKIQFNVKYYKVPTLPVLSTIELLHFCSLKKYRTF